MSTATTLKEIKDVTADDIVNVVEESATKDMQRMGGMEALDAPYLEIGFGHMIRRRAG